MKRSFRLLFFALLLCACQSPANSSQSSDRKPNEKTSDTAILETASAFSLRTFFCRSLKLSVPLTFVIRRCARVVDRAALEMRCTREGTGGSNPSISAKLFFYYLTASYLGELIAYSAS